MEGLTLSGVADALGVALPAGRRGIRVSSVSTDTRTLAPGAIYFAVRGEHFDGCTFLEAAFEAGAVAAVVPESAQDLGPDAPLLRVPDVRRALLALAKRYREDTGFRVVAITGSAGKTTTKELLFHMLTPLGEVVRAPKSFNNDIGLPLTLLSASPRTKVVVVELGTSSPGEIETLAAVAQPDVAIITCIGEAHLEGLGSVEGVAREKLSLLRHVRPGGATVLNGDDLRLRGAGSALASVRGPSSVSLCGFGEGLDWRARVLERRAAWRVATRKGQCPGPDLRLPLPGRHIVTDALLALAAAEHLGVSPEDAARSLETFVPPEGRQNLSEVSGVTLVDDTYNANPTSVCASLEAFSFLAPPRSCTAVLGAMCELGPSGPARHRAVGRWIAHLGIGRLVTVGGAAAEIARGARAAGMPKSWIVVVDDAIQVAATLSNTLRRGDAVLFKASRACRLERAFQAIRDHLAVGVKALAA